MFFGFRRVYLTNVILCGFWRIHIETKKDNSLMSRHGGESRKMCHDMRACIMQLIVMVWRES